MSFGDFRFQVMLVHPLWAQNESLSPSLFCHLVDEGSSKWRSKGGHAHGCLHITLTIIANKNSLPSQDMQEDIEMLLYTLYTEAVDKGTERPTQ